MINLVYLSYHDEINARGYWDHGFLLWLLSRTSGWREQSFLAYVPKGQGAVVVVPARHHAADADVARLNSELASLPWCLLILSGDEEHLFPVSAINHPNIRIWVQTPSSRHHDGLAIRRIPTWFPRQMAEPLTPFPPTESRELTWFFAGQVTNPERDMMMSEVHKVPASSAFFQTQAFAAQAIPHDLYYQLMRQSRLALCPAGPMTTDTFRVFEALESGCLPVTSARSSYGEDENYWDWVFPADDPHPFVVVDDWTSWSEIMASIQDDTARRLACWAWWTRYKATVAGWWFTDLHDLCGSEASPQTNRDLSVLMPTSPTSRPPDKAFLDTWKTINSVREHLAPASIHLMIDGVRPEQDDLRSDYYAYIDRLLYATRQRSASPIIPHFFSDFAHQANMTRATLASITTPYVAFVEHDTPLTASVPLEVIRRRLENLDLIRLYHYDAVPPEHAYLMDSLDAEIQHTRQWSQRPHIAHTSYYRRIIAENFPPDCRTMIEDRMHGICIENPAEHRLGLLAIPPMRRSEHLDGRGSDPKFEMDYGTI
jgi:hypothetical protein